MRRNFTGQEASSCSGVVRKDALVVICRYDALDIGPLLELLSQMRQVPSGATFDVLVVVNSVTETPPSLPEGFEDVDVLMRKNSGFNIGAWQAGWKARPDYPCYVFLQEDCFIERPNWLRAFIDRITLPRTGFVGEAEFIHLSWRRLEKGWPLVRERFEILKKEAKIATAGPPCYLQTVVVAASRKTLVATGGFFTGDHKATAVAGEILTSVNARTLGYINRQVAFYPYTYIGNPQCTSEAKLTERLRWKVSRYARMLLLRLITPVIVMANRRRWVS